MTETTIPFAVAGYRYSPEEALDDPGGAIAAAQALLVWLTSRTRVDSFDTKARFEKYGWPVFCNTYSIAEQRRSSWMVRLNRWHPYQLRALAIVDTIVELLVERKLAFDEHHARQELAAGRYMDMSLFYA